MGLKTKIAVTAGAAILLSAGITVCLFYMPSDLKAEVEKRLPLLSAKVSALQNEQTEQTLEETAPYDIFSDTRYFEPIVRETLSDEEALTDPDEIPLYSENDNLGSSYDADTHIPCTIGFLNYYNQSDPRWGDTPYGRTDLLKTHGCGPTAVAMVVSSLTAYEVTPPDIAVWASENGYCSSGEGSRHSLIPDALTHYGLSVHSLADRSIESVVAELRQGNLIITLMNRGFFTQSGHFLVLTQVTEDGLLQIADPASWENTKMTWNPGFILTQVREHADAGGPFWVVSLPEEE